MSVRRSYGFGSPIEIAWFTEDVGDGSGTRLAAAVVWRVGPASQPPVWIRRIRRLRFRLRALFGGFHLRGSPHWGGSSGMHGEREARYSTERRAVRVLGREYPTPSDGRALVLLIDEGPANRKSPVVIRTVVAPVWPRSAGSQTWTTVLESDPVVRAFMTDSP